MQVQKKALDRLSADDRAIVVEEMGKVFASMDVGNRADDQGAIEALKSHGISFVPADSGEAERWEEIAGQAIDKMVVDGLIDADLVARVRDQLRTLRDLQ